MSLLPRIDQLWYKYIHMEEMLGNVAGARQIFERWMQWEPDHHGWMAYVKVRSVGVRGGMGSVSWASQCVARCAAPDHHGWTTSSRC